AFVGLVWRIKLADIFVRAAAPLGAWLTFAALATGSIWGKPTWGTFWVWDARLTSELILLFLYMAYLALYAAFNDPQKAAKAGNIFILIGCVDIPIIHYSVNWWNTLHQGASLSLTSQPTIHGLMLYPLLAMIAGFMVLALLIVWLRARNIILWRERRSQWVQELTA
ncbi:MAG: heme ABC transporter permease CcmC, partial [Gammaproteobacteria bacterium]|nr:heme ABC transporter permease CcmC [Gammaproteobacteria bacterium]